jgi:ABC-type phosphate/phosphonate transport system substrate-binding protein
MHPGRNSLLSICTLLLFAVTLAAACPAQAADGLVLAIQPILDEAQTRKAFQPLCDYLQAATQRHCTLLVSTNFYAYWELVRHGKGFNLALDAAHFTDYRAEKFGFDVLAKIPGTVTYSLVTRDTEQVLDPLDLAGKRIATLGIPSIGAARLNGLFPNPSRQPDPVEVASAEQGMRMLLDGKVRAAIMPTPIVAQYMARGAGVSVVLTTDPIPHIALSAAPSLDVVTRAVLRKALLEANTSASGKKMLGEIGFERFDPASTTLYRGQEKVLQQYFGY